MSKKNIVSKVPVGNTVHVTFQTDQGQMTYEYRGSSARALKRGTDPSQLSGRLVKHDKKD
jgi:hypothetical protein